MRPAGILALLLLLGLGACDGRNLFQPVTEAPTIVALTAPPAADLGGMLPITARAVGVAAMDSIVITLEGGGIDTEITLDAEENEFDMLRSLEVEVPVSPSDFTVHIRAVAYDVEGNASGSRQAQVVLIDRLPPSASGQILTDPIGQGDTLRVRLTATDNVRLSLIGMRVRDPSGSPILNEVAGVDAQAADTVFTWRVPQDQAPGTYSVQVFADDQENRRTVSDAGTFRVEFRDIVVPEVSIEVPELDQIVEIGDSVFVRVRVQDEHRFQTVRIEGLSYRGDPDLGTAQTVQRFDPWTINLNQPVADTTLTRYLRTSGGDTTVEPAFVIVTATDLAGNVGADTVRVRLEEDPDPEEELQF
ncbi:MAG: hypothetical protein EA351_03285 [Gemmatimonadales bacterium]|nr:MAG: hypothetical protein EA351_03285 [Gemmatimonadales bacterium]